MEIIRTRYKEHEELILDRDSSIMSYSISAITANKMLTKQILKGNGIKVPIGIKLPITSERFILEAFKRFNKKVVLKPVYGSHGIGVYTDIENEDELLNCIISFKSNLGCQDIIIEEEIDGKEYRVFITRDGKYAVLHREPAFVIGDGVNTIRKLISLENEIRIIKHKNMAIYGIVIDEEAERILIKKGLNLDSILKLGEKVYLRKNSNIALGGLCIDYTEKVDKSVIEICKRVLESMPGMQYAGIDFMSKDIVKKQEEYAILEINSNPGVYMHMCPVEGKSRNVVSYLVDMIYPETKNIMTKNL